MKTISTQYATALAGETTSFCTLFHVERRDGFVLAATDLDVDVVLDGVTYAANSGYAATDVESGSDLDPDNLDIQGFLDSPSITDDDLTAGLWDYAAYRIFQVNYKDLTMGSMSQRSGRLGQVTVQRGQFVAELRGLIDAYRTTIGRMEGPSCNANLGDARCKVVLSAPTWQPNTGYSPLISGDAGSGSIVSPTVSNGRFFACTTAGTSDATEPTWNLTVGGTTNDGTVVWTTQLALTAVDGAITGVNLDGVTLYDTSRTEPGPSGGIAITGITNANPTVVTLASAFSPQLANGETVTLSGIVGPDLLNTVAVVRQPSGNTFQQTVDTTDTTQYPHYVSGGTVTRFGDSGFFSNGKITFTSGLNQGLSQDILYYDVGQFTLALPMPYAVQVGDTYTAVAGCDKSLATCRDRFFNIHNFRGFPYLPGTDKIVQIGRKQDSSS